MVKCHLERCIFQRLSGDLAEMMGNTLPGSDQNPLSKEPCCHSTAGFPHFIDWSKPEKSNDSPKMTQ